MKLFRNQLIQLLSIHGHSGQEKKVVNYLKPILTKLLDTVFVDNYGNLLGEKVVGTGEGATILLSAHMDTCRAFEKGRVLIETEDGIFTSSKGILGADDRAGIAIILAVLRNIEKSKFNGKIKVAFSREEEIGCVGAEHISEKWLSDVHLAIVVDRRGNRDVVINCGGYKPFCDTKVGKFFEEVGVMADMPDWKAVDGGISDAYTFSDQNINSVNLSAGYNNEHTNLECLDINASMDTIKLILQALAVVNSFYMTWGDVPQEVRFTKYDKHSSWSGWSQEEVEAWYRDNGMDYDADYQNEVAYQMDDNEQVFFDRSCSFGEVSASRTHGYVSIMQKNTKQGYTDEVFVSEREFEDMANRYYINKYGKSYNDLNKVLA